MGPVTVCSLRCHLFCGPASAFGPWGKEWNYYSTQTARTVIYGQPVHHVPVPLPRSEARGQAAKLSSNSGPGWRWRCCQCRCTVPVGPRRLSALPAELHEAQRCSAECQLGLLRVKVARAQAQASQPTGSSTGTGWLLSYHYPESGSDGCQREAASWDNTGRHWQPLSPTPALAAAALAVFACTLPTRWKVEARA